MIPSSALTERVTEVNGRRALQDSHDLAATCDFEYRPATGGGDEDSAVPSDGGCYIFGPGDTGAAGCRQLL